MGLRRPIGTRYKLRVLTQILNDFAEKAWDEKFMEKHIHDCLNSRQREAVDHLLGPVLILAGAGSGKTRALTHRAAEIIEQGLASAPEILCVTFTNKAAKEMEERIYKLLYEANVPVRERLWIGTFHNFGVRVLRSYAEALEYKANFTIYDAADQLSHAKKVAQALQLNEKLTPAKTFVHRVSSAKMMGWTPDDVRKNNVYRWDEKTLDFYALYQEMLKRANAFDFDDLLMKTYELFQLYPDILGLYQTRFKFVMVDEYQDTNHIQYRLVRQLSGSHHNLCVVGDEDQSIYSWRGADISNILNFEKDFPNAKIIKLEENYRSSGNIVLAASSVIANNSQRKDKTLFTSNPAGLPLIIREESSDLDEARYVGRRLKQYLDQGDISCADLAIFYRTNAQSRLIEDQLRTLSIPYKIVGGVRFYDRMEVKDVISYMKFVYNPADDVALKRIINTPTRGIGKTTVERLEDLAREKKLSLLATAKLAVDTREFNPGTTGKLRKFLDLIQKLSEKAVELPVLGFYQDLLEDTEYLVSLRHEGSEESLSRIDNLEELANAIAQFQKERGDEADLSSFLEEMALVSDLDSMKENQQTVTLMTLHLSKGLEYPYVFIVGLEENLFPSARQGSALDEAEIEEERRLAYVGITRAKVQLTMTYTRMRKLWGQDHFNPPSRFLKEIPAELTEFSTAMQKSQFHNRYQTGFVDARATGGFSTKPFGSRDRDFESQEFPEDDFGGGAAALKALSRGMNVRHPTFGVGSIFETEGSGEQQKVSVVFHDKTVKKFVVKYARLERV